MSVLNLGLLQLTPGNGLSISGTTLNVNVENSITVDSGTNCLALVGDTATPAASSYWGTNGAGTRGWYLLSSGDVTSISGTSQQIVASASTGAVTLSLATTLVLPGNSLTFLGGSSLTDNGTGALTFATTGNASRFQFNPSSSGNGGFGITVANNNAPNLLLVQNTSSGNAAASISIVGNGTNSLQFVQTSTGFSGAYIPGGVTGQVGWIIESGNVPLAFAVNGTFVGQWTAAGSFSVATATASTSTTTGSLINSGGFGNAGAVWLGADLNLAAGNMATFNGNDSASYAIQGATTGSPFDFRFIADSDTSTIRHFSFGWYTSNSKASSWNEVFNINSHSGLVNLTGTISASSATTGTLTVGNGTAATNVGIGGGNVNAGGTINAGGQITVTSNGATIVAFDTRNGGSGGNSIFQLETGDQSYSIRNGNGNLFEVRDDTNGVVPLKLTAGALSASTWTFASTTTSTSTTTGAVVVSGGVGIAGAMFVGGIATFSGTKVIIPAGSSSAPGLILANGNQNSGLYSDGNNGINISTNGTLAVAINSSQNTTLSGTTGTVLTITDGARGFTFQTSGANLVAISTASPTMQIVNSNAGAVIELITNGAIAVTVASNQNVTMAASLTVAGTITNASDSRLKTDIVDSDLGLSFILGLRPVAYTLRATPGAGRHYGLIAQELAATLGDTKVAAVSVDLSTGHYGIAYSQLIAPLIKGEQELHAEIVALKARVAELEGGLS